MPKVIIEAGKGQSLLVCVGVLDGSTDRHAAGSDCLEDLKRMKANIAQRHYSKRMRQRLLNHDLS